MTAPRLAIPALTIRDADGGVDEHATTAYARRAASTWLSVFILNGTTTEGASFSVAERAIVLDIWGEITDPDRLLACCWESADIEAAVGRGLRPLMVMRKLADPDAALGLFAGLPSGAYVYSHPMHTSTTLDADLINLARASGCLPAGAKISKIPAGTIPQLRQAAGPDFDLFDGSSRQIDESFRLGATGVVSTPLAAVPSKFPPPDTDLQADVNGWQARLDQVQGDAERARWLRQHALAADTV
jgi:dihydrodipicolinate synthase/N-acetylneuraminate lyase